MAQNDNQQHEYKAYKKEDAYETLGIINTWIGNMDTKVSFALTLAGVLIGAGKIHISIKVGIYDTPIQEDICICYQNLKRFVHIVRVPNSKLYSSIENLCWSLLVQLSCYQQYSKFATSINQKGIMSIVYKLFFQYLLRRLFQLSSLQ